ncbi:histone deacetylase [Stackebrandtia soli]|uniref:histone deacetylase n=1 Tax=Stackebrandtia soli TaxID=1892856 RepID=UPI0039E85CF0
MTTDDSPVWYVCYGSNLDGERFSRYVRGGRPDGGARVYPGCRDNSAPTDTMSLFIDGEVYFAGRSVTWGGGMAFLDPTVGGDTPGRAYRITLGQFADVCAQEQRRAPGTVTVPLADVADAKRLIVGTGDYAALHWLGDRDGEPMLTFTAANRLRPYVAPSPAYRNVIVAGLRQAHGWDRDRALAHLSGLPGFHGEPA